MAMATATLRKMCILQPNATKVMNNFNIKKEKGEQQKIKSSYKI